MYTYPHAKRLIKSQHQVYSMQVSKCHTFCFGLSSVLLHWHEFTVRKNYMDRSLSYKAVVLQSFPTSHLLYQQLQTCKEIATHKVLC